MFIICERDNAKIYELTMEVYYNVGYNLNLILSVRVLVNKLINNN